MENKNLLIGIRVKESSPSIDAVLNLCDGDGDLNPDVKCEHSISDSNESSVAGEKVR